jgi:hypothetical protein
LPVVLGAADWHERGLEVGQDTELGEDDGVPPVAVDVLILPSSISQMPVRGAFIRFPVGNTPKGMAVVRSLQREPAADRSR